MEKEERNIKHKRKRKKVTKVVKETSKSYIKDVVEMMLNMIPSFIKHIFNIVHQYRAIHELKKIFKTMISCYILTLVRTMFANMRKKYKVYILADRISKSLCILAWPTSSHLINQLKSSLFVPFLKV